MDDDVDDDVVVVVAELDVEEVEVLVADEVDVLVVDDDVVLVLDDGDVDVLVDVAVVLDVVVVDVVDRIWRHVPPPEELPGVSPPRRSIWYQPTSRPGLQLVRNVSELSHDTRPQVGLAAQSIAAEFASSVTYRMMVVPLQHRVPALAFVCVKMHRPSSPPPPPPLAATNPSMLPGVKPVAHGVLVHTRLSSRLHPSADNTPNSVRAVWHGIQF